jgi:carbonic anhydrase/acetyltransferase-like protein (isoleucine patch superfamily)
MTVAAFEGQRPRIGKGTYTHPSADVCGNATIGEGCWIGPGARIRGDYKAQWMHFKETYVDLARRYLEGYRSENGT